MYKPLSAIVRGLWAIAPKIKTQVEVSALIFGIAVGSVAILQYIDQVQSDFFRNTFEFVKLFHSQPIRNDWNQIQQVWSQPEVQAKLTELSSAYTITNPISLVEMNNYVTQTIADAHLSQAIASMVEFYKAVNVCIQVNACAKEATFTFFGKDARKFYVLHYPYFLNERKKPSNSNYAAGLEEFISAYNHYLDQSPQSNQNID